MEESTGVERYADTSRGGSPLSPMQRPEARIESDESREIELPIDIYGDSRMISLVH